MTELTDLGVIRDLAIVLIVAAVTTVLAHRVRQPVVLGYLVAGLIVGPFLLPSLNVPFSLVSDIAAINTLAQLGIIFLMFSIGLEFNIRRLRAIGSTATIAAIAEVAFLIWLGYSLGLALGWGTIDSLFLGALLSISSTIVVVKALEERGQTGEEFARLLVGILLVEDVAAIVIITLLPSSVTGLLAFGEVGAVLLQLGLFVVVALVLGLLLVPRAIDFVARLGSEEVLVICALGLCLGGALLAAALGLSVALGAFILGAVAAEARAWREVQRSFAPVRNMFTAVFFVSVGMLVDTAAIGAYAVPILLLAAAMIVAKATTVAVVSFLLGATPRTAIHAGMGLGNIGEFSFVIASRGAQLGVTSAFLFPITVGIAGVTTLLTPYLLSGATTIARGLQRVAPPPLLSYLGAYQAWIRRAREASPDPVQERVRTLTRRIAINLAILFVLLVTAGVVTRVLLSGVTFGPIAGPASLLSIWVVAGAFAVPSGLIVVQSVRELFRQEERPGGPAPGLLPASLVILTFLFLAVVLAILLGPLSRGLPPLSVALFAVTTVAVVAALAWRYVVRLHRQWEEMLQRVLGEEELRKDEVYALIRDYPVDLAVERVRVPHDSPFTYRTLGELDVKRATGATIVAVERPSGPVANAGAGTVVAPEDVLVLVGAKDQVETAKAFLLAKGPAPSRARLAVREFTISQRSPLADATLASSMLRSRTGATLLAVRRRGTLLANPPPETRMEPGDVIVVLGDEPALFRAAELADPRENG